jgi:flagellar basal-body rod modification protein FlgD
MQVSPAAAAAMTSALSATSSASSSASSSGASATPNINYNEFLQLLLTEMKNQDPTAPMDPTQSISQIATFSQVEQQVQTNSKLDAMLTSSALSQADSVIGRTITSADGSVQGQVASVTVSSAGATATLTNGQTVSLANGVTIS